MAEIVAGDRASVLRITVSDQETEQVVDLTARTVTLRYKINGGALVEKTMTVLDQVNQLGKAEYVFLAADVPEAGTMEYEVRLDAGLPGQLTTVEAGQLSIRAALT